MTNLSGTNLNNGAAVGPQGEGMDSPSTFPTYPAYKDSGVEWLGEVPEHWKGKPFFSLVSERCESNAGMKQENLLSLSYGRIVNKDINSLDGLLPASFETYQVVHPGDIVFRLTDLQNDKRSLRSAIVREAGIITSAYLAGVCRGIFPEFASFLFRAYDSIKVFYSMGGGLRQSMKYSDMKWLPIFLPEWQEQTQIARFLDHETARIDALIEEQQRLIELLKEKRQAVISHAVTKGLDSAVPMKDSGVEWLGEVPAHWEVKRLKHLCADIKAGPFGSALTKDMYVATGYKIYGQEQVIPGDFSIGDYYIDDERFESLRQYQIAPGDVLISCVGTFGKIAVVPDDAEPGIINPRLIRVRSNHYATPQYLSTVLHSGVVFEQFSVLSRGGTMDVINIGTLSEIVLAVPPLKEQVAILTFIEEQSRRFDGLMLEASGGVSLLQERRSALISAAVTGKIDVRGWQPPASTQAPKLEVAEAN